MEILHNQKLFNHHVLNDPFSMVATDDSCMLMGPGPQNIPSPVNQQCFANQGGLLTPPPTPEFAYECSSPPTHANYETGYHDDYQIQQAIYNQQQAYMPDMTEIHTETTPQINSKFPYHYENGMNYMNQAYHNYMFYPGHAGRELSEQITEKKIHSPLSRTSHNMLERMRRQNMKTKLSSLRNVIPELCKHDKAPKIQILLKAIKYIKMLNENELKLVVDKELEIQKKSILEKRLNSLLK